MIAARNAERTLAKCLDSLMKLDYPDYEVIVVDDGSTDGTRDIACHYPGIVLLGTGGAGPAVARNTGVKIARGEFVAFLDSDCYVRPDWLSELLRGFVDDRVAGVGGCQESPHDEEPFGREVHRFFSCAGFLTNYMQRAVATREVTHNASCNVMYRKAVYRVLGGFEEGFWPGEDLEFDHRVRTRGYRLFQVPDAIVYHYRADTIERFRNMMHRYGWAQGMLARRHGLFRPIQWVPVLMLLLAVGGGAGFLVSPTWTVVLAVVVSWIVWEWLGRDPALLKLFVNALFFWNAGFMKGLTERREGERRPNR
ncbi:MAG TPA: glycosyltransferase [Candidatus Omnitrophota bacterium]|nr:glycosyltransferase [Candidatus Omnitrophota bacterium]